MDVIEHFRGARNIKDVPSGLVLFREGEPGTEMYVMLEGVAEVSVGGEIVELATPGTLLGEMSLVDSAQRSATVVTRTDCRVVAVDTKQFDLLVRESPQFARHVMTVMAGRLRRMNERLKDAVTELNVRGRRPR